MRIAIQAADLDHARIDGTRVYILNLLKHFGSLAPEDDFLIYHEGAFNPLLQPPEFPNYRFVSERSPFMWTQTRFAWELWHDRPDVLWMPMQALPVLRRKGLRTVITVHDLAFKLFPECFPAGDRRRLNLYSDYAIARADRIIAVSESTRNDILRFYPTVDPARIRVVYHGFDPSVFGLDIDKAGATEACSKYGLADSRYLIYVGAIQPRKNVVLLIRAFEKLKGSEGNGDLRLVLAGEPAWQSDGTVRAAKASAFAGDIVMTGRIGFDELSALMRDASVFVFPSRYEGFGIPVLEAFASGVPAVVADNSSLREVGGDACLYFDNDDAGELAKRIGAVLSDPVLANGLKAKGKERKTRFSWEKCAAETLEAIRG